MALDLLKKQVGIVLEKRNIPNVTAQVAAIIDVSGSMQRLFNRGVVANTVERLAAVAFRMDDNDQLDTWVFSNRYAALSPVTPENYENYVQNVLLKEGSDVLWSGTRYADCMADVVNKFFGSSSKPFSISGLFAKKPAVASADPVFAMFITDGANDDERATRKIIEANADKNIYWEFIGIGNETFSFLEQIGDDYPNVGFLQIRDLASTPDDVLFEQLLNPEFAEWIKQFSK